MSDAEEEDNKIQTEKVYDVEDEIQDWKFLNKSSIPKRGEKEFEPDGTTVQTSALDESQKTMFDAISNVRGHHTKNKLLGIWMKDESYCLVQQVRGNYFKDLGKAINIGKIHGMRLNNLETIYLAERGSLIVYLVNDEYTQWLENQEEDFDVEKKLVALDLEYLYSLLAIPMAKYQVYAYLKRMGYVVQEFQQEPKTKVVSKDDAVCKSNSQFILWPRQWGILSYPVLHSLHFKSKHYFNYTDVFKTIRLNTQPVDYKPPSNQIHITFNVWKPLPTFSKKNPPPADFQLCVVDSSKNSQFLTLLQIQMLHLELPLEPVAVIPKLVKPKKENKKMQSKKEIRAKQSAERQAKLDTSIRLRNEYYRVRDGLFKNGTNPVVIAVTNNGIMNFLTLSQGQFTALQSNTRLNEIYPNRLHSIMYNNNN